MARYAEGNQLLHSFHCHFRVRWDSDHCCKQVWNDSTTLEDSRPWLTSVWIKHSTDSFLHDTYFYWRHRIMHHKCFFRWMHHMHHQSRNPTPWASFSFAPWEAAVQSGIFPLTAILYPIQPLAFGVFMRWQILNKGLGRTGCEFYSKQ